MSERLVTFYVRGPFLEAEGRDAETVGEVCGLRVRRLITSGRVVAGMPIRCAARPLQELLVAGYDVRLRAASEA